MIPTAAVPRVDAEGLEFNKIGMIETSAVLAGFTFSGG